MDRKMLRKALEEIEAQLVQLNDSAIDESNIDDGNLRWKICNLRDECGAVEALCMDALDALEMNEEDG